MSKAPRKSVITSAQRNAVIRYLVTMSPKTFRSITKFSEFLTKELGFEIEQNWLWNNSRKDPTLFANVTFERPKKSSPTTTKLTKVKLNEYITSHTASLVNQIEELNVKLQLLTELVNSTRQGILRAVNEFEDRISKLETFINECSNSK